MICFCLFVCFSLTKVFLLVFLLFVCSRVLFTLCFFITEVFLLVLSLLSLMCLFLRFSWGYGVFRGCGLCGFGAGNNKWMTN